MASPQERQDMKLEYPRRLMNSMICSFFRSRSSTSSVSLPLNMDLFPFRSSSRRSTTWTLESLASSTARFVSR